MQIARALILSHAGKKPLSDNVYLDDGCDTGRSHPTTESVNCLPSSIALPPDRARQCRRAVTFYGSRIARDKSGQFRIS